MQNQVTSTPHLTGDYTAAQVTNAFDKSTNQAYNGSTLSLTGSAVIQAIGSAATIWLSAFVSGDAANRCNVTVGGTITWGPGSGATDCSLSRTGVGVLTTNAKLITAGIASNPIVSGALSTISPSTTVGAQVSTTRDVFLTQVCTFNPSAGASATCVVAISPDNTTYSNLITVTIPAGIALDGTIPPISLMVPAAWYVKFTTTNATLGTGTYY